MNNLLILLLAFMLINLYIIGIAGKYKSRKSISDSDYWLTKPWKWLFEAIIGICALALFYTGYVNNIPLMWIGSIGIALVAVFSRFKKNNAFLFMHMLGAIGGFVLIALSFWINLGLWQATVSIGLMTFGVWGLTKNSNNTTWNVEISLIYSIFAWLFLYLLK